MIRIIFFHSIDKVSFINVLLGKKVYYFKMSSRIILNNLFILFTIFSFGKCGKFDDCRYGITSGNSSIQSKLLSEFYYNQPKSQEILRTKMYFKHPEPFLFSLSGTVNEVTFGKYKSNINNFLYIHFIFILRVLWKFYYFCNLQISQ